jgi:D-alanyl-D-alanine carboxypeptidase (penicillin-binding protein 5/6)
VTCVTFSCNFFLFVRVNSRKKNPRLATSEDMSLKHRLLIAASLLSVTLFTSRAADAAGAAPPPPAVDAGAWVLMDYTTGQILTAGNEHQQRNPASLTKLMTGYVVDRAIDGHRISPDDLVTVGRDAWAKDNPVFNGSSLMFLRAGERVSVRDLSRGLIVDSGNDACVALADYIAGGQPQFVALMNHYAGKLHLQDTHFETVHGLDAPGQHSSAYDLAVLSRAIIHGEPEFYHMYSEKSLTWNGITQKNRNGLLWDSSLNVDGLKTGHTSGAGFNLIASAVDGQRRLIAVVMGASSPQSREEQARKLLHWGQQNFATVQILRDGKKVASGRVWYGDKKQVALGTGQDFWMALPKSEIPYIKARYTLDKGALEAPIAARQRVGEIELYDRETPIAHWPLLTLEAVGKGGVFSRLGDYFRHKDTAATPD